MDRHSDSLLLVESDVSFGSLLSENLRSVGYTVRLVYSALDGLQELARNNIDACLYDCSVSDMDALNWVNEVRLRGIDVPLLILSNESDTDFLVHSYEAGIDSYIVKPFSIKLLLCQLQALIRLFHRRDTIVQTLFEVGGVVFDSEHQILGKTKMSTRESELMRLLCMSKGQIVSRSLILSRLWQHNDQFAARSLAVFISHLRSYLVKEHSRALILSVHGKGYKIIDN